MSDTATRLHPGLNLGPAHGEAHQKAEVVVFGFWVFLMSDLVVFALFFAAYGSLFNATAGGPGNADIVDVPSVALQTAFLLLSSFFFGLATLAMKYKDPPARVIVWLLAAVALGLCFLALEVLDFVRLAEAGATPMRSAYLSAFWALVCLHGFHVSVGSIMIFAVIAQIALFGLTADVKSRVLRLGLYWHFLDIIWVGIFTVVFLPGVIA